MNRRTNEKRANQSERIVKLRVDDIIADPNQPRKTFTSSTLSELTKSLSETGQISPIIVRPEPGGKYMIVVGERRWRAIKEAGIPHIECIVRHDIDDQKALEMQLAENAQREDIPPLEQAQALKNYLDKYKISQNELSRRTGIPQRTISDRLALLSLPVSVHAKIERGEIGPYEGLKIASLPSEFQEAIAELVAKGKLSSRTLEKLPKMIRGASDKAIKEIIGKVVFTENPSGLNEVVTKSGLKDNIESDDLSDDNVEIYKKATKHKTTAIPEEANTFVVTPRKCEISSMLLLIAKHVCEVEWNWPKMSVEDFLDTYLYETMKQRGIIIGAYQKVESHNKTED